MADPADEQLNPQDQEEVGEETEDVENKEEEDEADETAVEADEQDTNYVDDDNGDDDEDEGDDDDDLVEGANGEGEDEGSLGGDDDDNEDEGDNGEEDDQSDSDDDSDDDNSDEDDDEGPSTLEKRRFERIKRNKALLTSLGLGDNKPEAKPKQQRKREKIEIDPNDIRKSSRSSKKPVNYTVPKAIRERPETANKVKRPRKEENDKEKRMELFIFHEFRRIKSSRRNELKMAEKRLRYSQVELNYATKRAAAATKKSKRRQEIDKVSATLESEKTMFGLPLRDMLQDVDRRQTELQWALRQFDGKYMVSGSIENVVLKCYVSSDNDRCSRLNNSSSSRSNVWNKKGR